MRRSLSESVRVAAAMLVVAFFAVFLAVAFFAGLGASACSVEEACSGSSLSSVRTMGNKA